MKNKKKSTTTMKNERKSKLYIETPFNVDYTVEFMNVTLRISQ